jgi:hypothetical protein
MNGRLFLLIFVLGASAAPSPSPTPAPQYAYVTKIASPPAADPSVPQILEIDVNAQQLTAPGPLDVRVLTSPNVTAVFAHVSGQTFSIPFTQAGQFELAMALPALPSYMRGRSYDFDIEALTADGRRTNAGVPLSVAP